MWAGRRQPAARPEHNRTGHIGPLRQGAHKKTGGNRKMSEVDFIIKAGFCFVFLMIGNRRNLLLIMCVLPLHMSVHSDANNMITPLTIFSSFN